MSSQASLYKEVRRIRVIERDVVMEGEERREERGERRERGKRVSGNEIYGAYDGTGCDGATKSELFSNFYMYY